MALQNAGIAAGVNGITGAGTWIAFHTGDPGSTGANEVSGGGYARQQTTWPTATAGSTSSTGSQVTASIAAGTTLNYWSIWSAQTGGTLIGTYTLAAAESFGSAGQMKLTPTVALS